ncbi:cytochrome P450 [Russula aff. rugulosa BPL654]|nr:cytochrome P450 [Russula aff. rugulosa BPL654]
MPSEGTAMDAVAPKPFLLRPMSAPTIKVIWEHETGTLTAGIVLGLLIILVVRYIRSPWRKLPPSPRRLPILGHVLHIRDRSWLQSKDCKERFGEVMYLDGAGQPIIVCNSLKSAFQLLERRSGNYSDRPRLIMAQEILNGGLLLGLLRHDDRWRRMRRHAHEALTKRVVQNYHPIQMKEATILVSSLLKPSANLQQDGHFKRLAASTIMSIVYDYPSILSENDHVLEKIERYNDRIGQAAAMGSYLVDIFPWMIHIPKRFAKWKREGLRAFAEDSEMFRGLLNRVKSEIANGGSRPSFCASLIQHPDRDSLSEIEMAFLAGQLYSAGAETTSTTLSWWMLAMIAFPKVQLRAQAEIDAVVGRDRLPTFADALVFPLGVPHVATKEDWYEGMYIPKGTICISNLWNCNHDRAVFGEDADEFRPERHLDEHGELLLPGPVETYQAGHVSFGFGRRICVGKDLATESLFINTVRILWAATLERRRDENGKEVPLDVENVVDAGIVTRPVPYDCVVKPRFAEVESILAEERERFGI